GSLCLARAAGEEHELPLLVRNTQTPIVRVAFALVEARGRILLVRRPTEALLGGLWGLPGGETPDAKDNEREALLAIIRKQAGVSVRLGSPWARVDRTFSHRKWSGAIYRGTPRGRPKTTETVRWISRDEALQLPLVPFHREAIEALGGIESFAGRS
ncbi:MAG: NUDIX domain-containing protein, partial [Thermoplasmata archaeon]|nr:NUDIX domain-containing protein [Thermoplasmata archaeon]